MRHKILLLLALFGPSYINSSEWTYTGQLGVDNWPGICATGQQQSPIDLKDEIYTDKIDPFTFINYEKMPNSINIVNNGHSAKYTYDMKEGQMPRISGGGLGFHEYEFAQAHFHWGATADIGSEHLVRGKAYPLELHLVHYNTRYGGLGESVMEPDGLAVLGIMFEVVKENQPDMDSILDAMQTIKNPGSQINSEKPVPMETFLPQKTTDFYRYNGSLTTPPCAESVTWTVFHKPLLISVEQLDRLRHIDDNEGYPMVNNFRPPMEMFGRKVYTTFDTSNMSFTYDPKAALVIEAGAKGGKYDVYTEKPKEVDHFFLIIMSIIIFFMQCGFAFMEAGAVRSKNTVNILIKNWLDMCIGALVYWAVGFALTFGGSSPGLNRFMGSSYFFFYNMPDYKLSKWFFQFVFAATAATLVSGSLAERCNFVAYIVYSVMITGFIYPIIAHWTWHREGWLRINGYHDFAGSGVVHLTGAVCAFVGCILMGPRIGRFDKSGKPVPMPGHSVPLSALGGLILVFGFFACNGTKQGSISHPGDGIAVSRSIVNTALGTAAAGLMTLMFNKTGIVPGTGHTYSFLNTMNGALTGTVALCAGCNVFPSWGAVVVGAVCGPLFLYFRYVLLVHMQIDDPLDAISVHGIGGVWGVIAVYIFKTDGLLLTWSQSAAIGLGWNLIGLAAIFLWTGITCYIMFWGLKQLNMLRVETEMEFKGMDIAKHGESAYPADAWVETQYMKEDAVVADMGISADPNSASTAHAENGKGNGKGGQGSMSRDALPPNMKFSRSASYNNPKEMFPAASRLFSGMNSVAGNVTVKPSPTATKKLNSLAEEATEEEKTPMTA